LVKKVKRNQLTKGGIIMCEKEKVEDRCEGRCEGKNAALELHPCPYAEDVCDDHDSLCNCCEDCMEDCSMDV
jgi:hypothetical protein